MLEHALGTGISWLVEQVRRELQKQADGQPDDVGEIAVKSLDETRPETLDGVRARAVAPLPGGEVGVDQRVRQLSKGDQRALDAGALFGAGVGHRGRRPGAES